MKYSRICQYVASSLWAIDPSKLSEILGVLAYHAGGDKFTAEEIRARIQGGEPRQPARSGGAVAVIPIHGTIAHRMSGMSASSGGASIDLIGATFRAAMADPSVSSILFDIDSPGGTVTGVQELADDIYAARSTKPIVALVNGMAASAAYWLASQADEIVSIPSGSAGSIGVFTAHQDLSEMMAKAGIKTTLISAGKYKLAGHPFAPLPPEEEAVLQERVDAMYSIFVKQVARGRGVSPADVRNGYGQGRALTGSEAKAAGLVDRIVTVEEAVSRAERGKVGMRADDLIVTIQGSAAISAGTTTESTATSADFHGVPTPTLVVPVSDYDRHRGRVL